jgi:hypothetical protein
LHAPDAVTVPVPVTFSYQTASWLIYIYRGWFVVDRGRCHVSRPTGKCSPEESAADQSPGNPRGDLPILGVDWTCSGDD